MPLLLAQPVPPPPPPPPKQPLNIVDLSWTSPDGSATDLMHRANNGTGALVMLDGVEGFGAAPREVTRRALATGGSYGRWSHMNERPLTLPVHLHADTAAEFLAWRRAFTLLFTATVPAAGAPRPGILRVTRGDGSWREIYATYSAGLSWQDSSGYGIIADVPVLELIADDPWWYGEQQYVLDFAYVGESKSYFNPYETLSPATATGESVVTILGDGPALPVWTVTGPAEQVIVGMVDGPHWKFGTIEAGETITVDVAAGRVYDNTGTSRFGDLTWPTSKLFPIPVGQNTMQLELTGGLEGQSRIQLAYRPRWETA